MPKTPQRLPLWVKVRLLIATTLLLTGLVAIAYKAYVVQVVEADHYRELARRQHLRMVEVPAPRGVIYDASGKELAITANIDSVFCNPRRIVNVAGSAEQLAKALDLDIRVIESKLSSGRHFEWIKRHVDPAQAAAVRDANIPGVEVTDEPRRFYPNRALAGPLLGFSDIDGNGLDGLELALDKELRGRRTKVAALRDAHGRTMLSAEEHATAIPNAVAGSAITLTLDSFIQFATERALADAIAQHNAAAGNAVVLDVKSGSVLAMASWPTYDPNDSRSRGGARNRAVTDAYEIGSVMKVFSVAAAIEAGAVRAQQWINTEAGRYKIGRKLIRDTYRDKWLTVGGVLKRSSNVGAIKIAQALGAKPLHAALKRYGFGAKTGIELRGERSGILRSPSRWGAIGLATHSFGYGMTVTTLQVVTALAAIGNGGILMPPRIVARIQSHTEQHHRPHDAPQGRRIMAEATAAALLPILASVFDPGKMGGTARTTTVAGFRAGGKTGTAHKFDSTARTYSKDRYLSSFMGLAPIDEPRLAMIVLIDEPRGEHYYGGKVAAPVFARVVAESLSYLNVPSNERVAGSSKEPAVPPFDHGIERAPPPDDTPPGELAVRAPLQDHQIAIPSFSGLGIGAALDRARAYGLDVHIDGTGLLFEQFPPSGLARRDTVVHLVFDDS